MDCLGKGKVFWLQSLFRLCPHYSIHPKTSRSSLSFQLADLLSMFISSVVIVIIIVSNTLALNVSQSRHAWRTGSTFSRHSSSLTAYSDWAHFQRSTVRLYEQRKKDFTKHHKFPLSLLPNYLRGVLSWRQGLTYSQEPPFILTTPDSV